MWTRLRAWWRRLSTLRSARTPSLNRRPTSGGYRIVLFGSRGEAQAAARTPQLVAIFGAGRKHKWAYLLCPCGCGQQLALNLMTSQRPVWRVTVRSETDFSIFPSVDSTTCGAHFWVSGGRITWSE